MWKIQLTNRYEKLKTNITWFFVLLRIRILRSTNKHEIATEINFIEFTLISSAEKTNISSKQQTRNNEHLPWVIEIKTNCDLCVSSIPYILIGCIIAAAETAAATSANYELKTKKKHREEIKTIIFCLSLHKTIDISAYINISLGYA